MVYRRKHRTTYEAHLVTRSGAFTQVALRTSNKAVASHRETMWNELAREHQAWDILERVLNPEPRLRLRIDRLHDQWKASRFNVHELRRRLQDADIEPLVAEWQAIYTRKGVASDTAVLAALHVRAFVPAGVPALASTFTVARLTELLYGYTDHRGRLPKPNTLRKVHSSLSGFFDYLTRVKGLYPANPMLSVEPPAVQKSPVRFYESDAVSRIVGYQETPMRRALFALAYGGAIEISVLLGLTRADLWPATKEVRAAGTKTHTRDRVSRIADWAWPIVWEYGAEFLPTARLFPPALTRWTASDWHRQTVDALGLPRFPLHNARHHWAVRALRGGYTIAAVQQQLGHSSATLTLEVYGRFRPTSDERDRYEQDATRHEQRRRDAK